MKRVLRKTLHRQHTHSISKCIKRIRRKKFKNYSKQYKLNRCCLLQIYGVIKNKAMWRPRGSLIINNNPFICLDMNKNFFCCEESQAVELWEMCSLHSCRFSRPDCTKPSATWSNPALSRRLGRTSSHSPFQPALWQDSKSQQHLPRQAPVIKRGLFKEIRNSFITWKTAMIRRYLQF